MQQFQSEITAEVGAIVTELCAFTLMVTVHLTPRDAAPTSPMWLAQLSSTLSCGLKETSLF